MTKMQESYWYAFYTQPRAEKRVAQRLADRKIEHYLPLSRTLKKWSDRRKWVEEPLIRSYIFIKYSELRLTDLHDVPGIVRYISFAGKPARVQEEQLNLLKRMLKYGLEVEVAPVHFESGQKVEIEAGPLTGMTAEIVTYKNKKKVLVRLDEISHSILVTIDTTDIAPQKS